MHQGLYSEARARVSMTAIMMASGSLGAHWAYRGRCAAARSIGKCTTQSEHATQDPVGMHRANRKFIIRIDPGENAPKHQDGRTHRM